MTRKHSLLANVSAFGMSAAERQKGRFMRAPDEHPKPDDAPGSAPVESTPAEPTSFDDAFAVEVASDGPPPADPKAPAEAAPVEAAPVEAAPVEAAPAEAAPPTADEILKGLTEAIKTRAEPAAPAPAAAAAPAAAEQPPIYTTEELNVIAEYHKDWPDVARAETLKRRAEYSDLLAFTFQQVQQQLAPMVEQLRTMGNTMHMGELKTLVPDYSDLVETEVTAWISTQPSYLQAGMNGVMQGGTTDEVADLIGRYRAASGTAPATPAAAPAAVKVPAAPKATELSTAAKQAAASLAPVGSERTQIPVGEDSQDYGSAFARFAALTE